MEMDDEWFDMASEQAQKHVDWLYQLADRLATMATGALTLTIVFRKDISPTTVDYLWMLKVSWVAFICTIIGFFIMYLGRISMHNRLKKSALGASRASLPDSTILQAVLR